MQVKLRNIEELKPHMVYLLDGIVLSTGKKSSFYKRGRVKPILNSTEGFWFCPEASTAIPIKYGAKISCLSYKEVTSENIHELNGSIARVISGVKFKNDMEFGPDLVYKQIVKPEIETDGYFYCLMVRQNLPPLLRRVKYGATVEIKNESIQL